MFGSTRSRLSAAPLLSAGVVLLTVMHGQCEVSDARLYELIRELKQPKPTNYMREWLVCGEFPNPPHPGQKTYDHTPPCVGFETDYLEEHGGEESIRPYEGLTHTRPDGSIAEWRLWKSDADIIDFTKVFADRPKENQLAYAFGTVTKERATKQYLAVGSDDGVMVWVNGELVHDHLVPRGVRLDQDLVLVDFVEGENTVLLKVENGAGAWGFSCRLIAESAMAGERLPFQPKIESKIGESPLRVQPNAALAAAGATGDVIVEVLRPGGNAVARARVSGGKLVEFPTDGWPEGPYEIRCSMDAGFGKQRVVHLPWFYGDARAAGIRLKDAAASADPETREGALVRLLDWIARDRAGDLTRLNAGNVLKAHSALMEFEELLLDGEEQLGSARPHGFARLSYRDEIDNSWQYCRAYLPADYDPAEKWPLIVNLHGFNNDNPAYVKWENIDARHHKWADEYPLIVLEPLGRRDSWYKGIGIRDVLQNIELAKERFSVDEDRLYLTGSSMGGGGVWEIGTRHPEVFAALAPVYGGWDDRIFLDKAEYDRLTARQRFEAACYSSFARAESLLTTPVFINHGTKDLHVVVEHARLAVRMMQRWGYDVRYWEHKDLAHEYDKLGHEDAMLEWLLQQRRVAHPRRVRIHAPELKAASAHWVRVENREDPQAFINVDAEIVAPNFVRVNTENALSLTLSPGGHLVDPAQPLRVDWNGYGMPSAMLVNGKATFNAPDYRPGPLPKRPERAGPIQDVFTTPFAIVMGTTSPERRMRRMCERRANRLSDAWNEQQYCRPRLYKDTEIGEDDLARYSLLLIGGPKENAVTKRLIDDLPLRIDGDTVVIDGHPFEAPDALVRMIYPHPLNDDRYVVVTASTSSDAMYYRALDRNPLGFRLLDSLDFYIADGRVPDAASDRPSEKTCLVSGHFDHNWRYCEDFVVRGDGAQRSACPREMAPDYLDLPLEEDTFYVSDLLELTTTGGFNDVARDTNAKRAPLELEGQEYDKGLGLSFWRLWEKRSAIEWNIDGHPWSWLLGKVGLQTPPDVASLPKHMKDDTKVRFYIKFDGKEVLKTDQLKWNSLPVDIDLDVWGVKRLRLEVLNEGGGNVAPISANWVDLRLTNVEPEWPDYMEDDSGMDEG